MGACNVWCCPYRPCRKCSRLATAGRTQWHGCAIRCSRCACRAPPPTSPSVVRVVLGCGGALAPIRLPLRHACAEATSSLCRCHIAGFSWQPRSVRPTLWTEPSPARAVVEPLLPECLAGGDTDDEGEGAGSSLGFREIQLADDGVRRVKASCRQGGAVAAGLVGTQPCIPLEAAAPGEAAAMFWRHTFRAARLWVPLSTHRPTIHSAQDAADRLALARRPMAARQGTREFVRGKIGSMPFTPGAA